MKLIPLNCNHCGAPLEAPEDARFVTCAFCEQQLAVERSGSVYSTRLLEDIRDQTESVARDLKTLKRHAALQVLDRQWQEDQRAFYITGRNGNFVSPSRAQAVVGMIMSGIIAVVGFGVASIASGLLPGILRIVPMLFLIVPVLIFASCIQTLIRADKMDDARRDYQAKRAALENEFRAQ